MSVLIKGMDKPKKGSIIKCTLCVAPSRPASLSLNSGHGKPYNEFYELVEVPTPHGRLIDADRLIAVMESVAGTQERLIPLSAVLGLIKNSKTIIEAEE